MYIANRQPRDRMMAPNPRRCRRIVAMVIAATALAAGPGRGAEQTAALTAVDRADIARSEAFLDGMRTLRSDFVQTASNGSVAEGTIYIRRPGLLRIDYRPPTPLQVYADGTWLIFVDRELKQVNQLPLSATPADFLVRDRIRLSGDVSVERVTRRRGTIRLHLSQTGHEDAGRLIVTLAAKPLGLRGWTIVDAQGIETTVTLLNPAVNPEIENSVFAYSPPEWAFPSND